VAVTLRLRRTFAAPRQRVFQAWTTPQEMKRWTGPGEYTTPLAEVDLRPGGRYRIHMRTPDGTLRRLTECTARWTRRSGSCTRGADEPWM
jgi:uncharacterized protein YndB with AHSA1/START domain